MIDIFSLRVNNLVYFKDTVCPILGINADSDNSDDWSVKVPISLSYVDGSKNYNLGTINVPISKILPVPITCHIKELLPDEVIAEIGVNILSFESLHQLQNWWFYNSFGKEIILKKEIGLSSHRAKISDIVK